MAVVKNMMVRVGADFSSLIGGSQKALGATQKWAGGTQKAFSGVASAGSALRTALGAIGIGVSLAGLVQFGRQAVELGSELSEVQNVVDTTFPQMRGEIDTFAQNAASSFGLSETMAKRFSGTFGAMAKAFGFTEREAANMSTTLTGLAGDVASFYNVEQEEAFSKLKGIFTGETEGLKSLGIVMTQTALDQFALSQGMGQTTAQMTEQQKAALRYQFVLSRLSAVSGDFSRTSGSWANQTRLLRLQWDSLSASIGQGLIAALTPAIRGLNTLMGALVKTANTFKAFMFSLFGQPSEDMSVGSGALTELESAAGGAGAAFSDMGDNAASGAGKAAEAAKSAAAAMRQLFGFDKINKLQSETGSGGGSGGSGGSSGGGSSGGLGDTSSALKDTAYSVGEVMTPLDTLGEKLRNLASSLKLTFEDVFMDWGEKITPENVCEKVIVGLGGVLGGAAGFMIGGVPGAIVGTLVGVGLSLLFDSLVFNHDGKVSKRELADMSALALGGLTGGLMGFFAGGPAGALVGATIGAGAVVALKTLDFAANGRFSGVIDNLVHAAGIACGGLIGFLAGGPAGAALGIAVGAGITLTLKNIGFADSSGWTAADWGKNIAQCLAPVAGAAIGFVVGGGPAGAVLGGVIGMNLSFIIKELDFTSMAQAFESFKSKLSDSIGAVQEWLSGIHLNGPDAILKGEGLINIPDTQELTVKLKSIWASSGDEQRLNTYQQTNNKTATGTLKAAWTTSGENRARYYKNYLVNKNVSATLKGNWGSKAWDRFSYYNDKIKTKTVTGTVNAKAGSKIEVRDIIKPGGINFNSGGRSVGSVRAVPYAKGGIVNAATLFGGRILAGEDGREAIVPLERNMDWVRPVASQLARELAGNGGGQNGAETHVHLHLDGREIYQTVIRKSREDAARGLYPLAGLI